MIKAIQIDGSITEMFFTTEEEARKSEIQLAEENKEWGIYENILNPFIILQEGTKRWMEELI